LFFEIKKSFELVEKLVEKGIEFSKKYENG